MELAKDLKQLVLIEICLIFSIDLFNFYMFQMLLINIRGMWVKAVEILRGIGHNVHLNLVGGGSGSAQRRLDNQIQKMSR